MLRVTGQRGRSKDVKVVAEAAPIVSLSDLTSSASALNVRSLSGKEEGAVVLVKEGGEYYMYVAEGDKANDAWSSLSVAGATPPPVETIDILTCNVVSGTGIIIVEEHSTWIKETIQDMTGQKLNRHRIDLRLHLGVPAGDHVPFVLGLNGVAPPGQFYFLDTTLGSAYVSNTSPCNLCINHNGATTSNIPLLLSKDNAETEAFINIRVEFTSNA